MSRTVDESKLESVKKAVISLVVEKGYSNTSTAMIAKQSGVSEGYLYRYYSKKYDLVYDVLQEHIYLIVDSLNALLQSGVDFEHLVEKLITTTFLTAKIYPDKIKFLNVLMHDYSFQQSEALREDIYKTCISVLELGKKDGTVRGDVTIEEIFQMIIFYPIEFLNVRMKNFFGVSEITDDDVKKSITFILNSLR